VVARGYYATQDTLYPTIYATAAAVFSIPVYYLGMRLMGANGVALAVSLSAIFQAGLLYAVWNRRTSNIESNRVYLFYGKLLLISIPMGVFLEWMKNMLYVMIHPSGFIENFIIFVIIGILFLSIFVLCGHALHFHEISDLTQRFISRLWKKKG
jgi:putative peptidoglycan lipid II flippase